MNRLNGHTQRQRQYDALRKFQLIETIRPRRRKLTYEEKANLVLLGFMLLLILGIAAAKLFGII